MNKIIFILLLNLMVIAGAHTQETPKENYQYPWAGGMNSVQFGEVDINRDGIMDLVVFDRQGNRIIPFVNGGHAGVIDYSYAPEYVNNFPKLYDWAIFADYNNDGKADIFTYSPGWAGMIVYKNISDDTLKFKKEVEPYLTSEYSGGEVNILVTYADYPAISDLDNDGDLDILTFWGLGSFVEMHKNMSMELYGNADSLKYMHTETCWGHFAESDESNLLYLDTCIGKYTPRSSNEVRQYRHTGSTFLMVDLDADDDKDLILGDVDYPGLFALINGGDPENARITEIDTLFPRESNKPIRIFSMPVAAYIDINNDTKKDLLVSTFDPSPFISKNLDNVHVYLNSGENNEPYFSFYTDSFLQDNMIDLGSGANPVFYDFDHDGLKDLFVGNYGYYKRSWYENYTLYTEYKSSIAYFKNIGTTENPVFKFMDFDFGGFYLDDKTLIGLSPAFGDINNDGEAKMIAGNSDGTLILCTFSDGDIKKTYNYAGIDVGDYSTPQLFDLDNDGLLDLIIGKQDGKLSYYHNEGTPEIPDFVFKTDFLGEVDVTDYALSWYGYSTPYFFRKPDGETMLLTGSEEGILKLFTNIDNNLEGKFDEVPDIGSFFGLDQFDPDRGYRTAPAVANLDGDEQPELITGNFSGGMEFFGAHPDVLMSVKNNIKPISNLKLTPNPANDFLKISLTEKLENGKIEIYSTEGKIIFNKPVKNKKSSEITINTQNFTEGMYIVRLISNGRFYTAKLLIYHH
jgi:hypothetical protein